MTKQTVKAWAKVYAEKQQAAELVSVTEEQYIALMEQRKRDATLKRSVNRTVVAMEILEQLQLLQARSATEQITLVVITPLSGEKQVIVPVTADMDMETVGQKLAAYYQAVFAEEEWLKLPENKIEGFSLKTVPKSKYRLDLYMAGRDVCMGATDFAELSRKTLKALPSLLRLVQRVAGKFVTPEGVEIANPKFNPLIQEKVNALVAAANA